MNQDEILNRLRLNPDQVDARIDGGNSVVLKVKLINETFSALKIYKGSSERVERMLVRESKALIFLEKEGFSNIPKLLEVRKDLGVLAYKWIEGEPPCADKNTMNQIISMCLNLHQLQNAGKAFENAIDSAFSSDQIIGQIYERLERLKIYSSAYLKKISFN